MDASKNCFIPAELALTSSGDGTAHLWRAVVSLPSNLELSNKCQSSGEEELDGSEDDNLYDRDVFNDSVPNSNSFSVSANNHAGKIQRHSARGLDSVGTGGEVSCSYDNRTLTQSIFHFPEQSYVQANHSMSPPNSANVLSYNNHQV